MPDCKQCKNQFEIRPEDKAFYHRLSPVFDNHKYELSEPDLCPDCRQQNRLAFRNERSLYLRKCGLSGKQIISVYAPESPYTVYDQEEWWSDKWDPLTFGRDFDFSRPFFEQFGELMRDVPRRNLIYFQNENSAYTNVCSNNKDCYLLFSSDYNRSCLYVSNIQKCIDCVDCSLGGESELCYECFNFHRCYHCLFSANIENCRDCFMVYDCKNCQNCAFSVGLRGKEFHIYNKPYSKEEYFQFMNNRDSSKFSSFLVNQPHQALNNINTENCTGDYLHNSKNCFQCFNVSDSEDSQYIYDAVKCKNCFDCNEIGYSELCYQVIEAFPDTYNSHFVFFTANTSDINYCDHCYNSSNLFGCVGLKRNSYCVFNKQYSKDEYGKLTAKIVEHMQKTGEWGCFFPVKLSPFAYNETIAQDYYPLSEEEALKAGFKWRPKNEKEYRKATATILACSICCKNYKTTDYELNFYKKLSLPIPINCPDCRYKDRIKWKNPRQLYSRTCARCSTPIQTTYSPARPEIIYCEKCYLETVY